jgi:hypothetical protein
MHRRHVLLAAAGIPAIAATGAIAQGTAASASEATPMALIERAERDWAQALVRKDRKHVAAVIDERFQLIQVDRSRSVDHDRYLQHQVDANAIRGMTPTKISVFVNSNVAVAVVNMTVDWAFEWHRHWRFTDTWVWRDGEWRVVSRVSQFIQTH